MIKQDERPVIDLAELREYADQIDAVEMCDWIEAALPWLEQLCRYGESDTEPCIEIDVDELRALINQVKK